MLTTGISELLLIDEYVSGFHVDCWDISNSNS